MNALYTKIERVLPGKPLMRTGNSNPAAYVWQAQNIAIHGLHALHGLHDARRARDYTLHVAPAGTGAVP